PVAAPEGGCAPARASVMANRWAIGLSVGSMSLAPKGSPDDKTDFGVGELALRFRATPHLELELTAGGGRERTADNQDGGRAGAWRASGSIRRRGWPMWITRSKPSSWPSGPP